MQRTPLRVRNRTKAPQRHPAAAAQKPAEPGQRRSDEGRRRREDRTKRYETSRVLTRLKNVARTQIREASAKANPLIEPTAARLAARTPHEKERGPKSCLKVTGRGAAAASAGTRKCVSFGDHAPMRTSWGDSPPRDLEHALGAQPAPEPWYLRERCTTCGSGTPDACEACSGLQAAPANALLLLAAGVALAGREVLPLACSGQVCRALQLVLLVWCGRVFSAAMCCAVGVLISL